VMLTEFDYAFAEAFFATGYDPLVVRIFGSLRVVGSMLFNPSEDAADDDLDGVGRGWVIDARTCVWKILLVQKDRQSWRIGCGRDVTFPVLGPGDPDASYNYCPYCGGRIVQKGFAER
jgi:DNA-directed RNA polymerase subunit RPC12/RpoP